MDSFLILQTCKNKNLNEIKLILSNCSAPIVAYYLKAVALVPELISRHLAQLVELDLFGKDIERDVDRAA